MTDLARYDMELFKLCTTDEDAKNISNPKIVIVKLLVPKGSKITDNFSEGLYYGSRVEKAKVVDICDEYCEENFKICYSYMSTKDKCIYKLGEYVYPDTFTDEGTDDMDNWHGIHGYKSVKEVIQLSGGLLLTCKSGPISKMFEEQKEISDKINNRFFNK